MKKCLVLDLDNTLWGGIIGEDGIDGLALSTTTPGNSFIAFQQAILDHYNRGVILAINSRNNEEDALHVIRNHPNMILKEHHFAAHRINWQDKATNIRELARELNIGLDSMVFLDDDITNREMVKALVPEVVVPDMPKNPEDYTKFLHSLNYFATHVVTDEDTMRGNLYVTERLRKEQEKQFITRDAFLESLSLELFFYENDTFCIPRLAQLTMQAVRVQVAPVFVEPGRLRVRLATFQFPCVCEFLLEVALAHYRPKDSEQACCYILLQEDNSHTYKH
jgi:FkbH-like protein